MQYLQFSAPLLGFVIGAVIVWAALGWDIKRMDRQIARLETGNWTAKDLQPDRLERLMDRLI